MVQKLFHENGAQRYRQGTAKVPPSGTARVTALGISDDETPLPDEHRYPANVHRQPACASTLSRMPGCEREAGGAPPPQPARARAALPPRSPAPLPRPAPPRRAVRARQAATSAPRSAAARQAPSGGDGRQAATGMLRAIRWYSIPMQSSSSISPRHAAHVQAPSGTASSTGTEQCRCQARGQSSQSSSSPAPPHTAHASTSQSGQSHPSMPSSGGGSRHSRWKRLPHAAPPEHARNPG